MSDRANRIGGVLCALALVVIGGLGLSVALGAWGDAGPVRLVDPVVVRWWRDGAWMSFAALALLGLVLLLAGSTLVWAELRPRGPRPLGDFEASPRPSPGDGAPTGPTKADPPARGLTTVRAAPLCRALEADLRTVKGVRHASARLSGDPGSLALRAQLDVGDSYELAELAAEVGKVAERLELTAGFGPEVMEVTLFLVTEAAPRLT